MFKSIAVALLALGVLSFNRCGTNSLYRGPVAGLNTGVGAVALDANDINRI